MRVSLARLRTGSSVRVRFVARQLADRGRVIVRRDEDRLRRQWGRSDNSRRPEVGIGMTAEKTVALETPVARAGTTIVVPVTLRDVSRSAPYRHLGRSAGAVFRDLTSAVIMVHDYPGGSTDGGSRWRTSSERPLVLGDWSLTRRANVPKVLRQSRKIVYQEVPMSRGGIFTFSDARDFVTRGVAAPKRAPGTRRARNAPSVSSLARTTLPRTSPRCT